MITTIKGYPFVSHVEQTIKTWDINIDEKFKDTMFYRDLLPYGYIKMMGYEYDLTPHLKHYIIDTNNGLYKYYAPNKTTLRKCLPYYAYGKIIKIIEINY